jgi:anti-sigma factor RsiW
LNHVEPGQLVDLARGLIDESEAAALRPHLDECDRCRAVLDHLSLVVRAARAASAVPATAVREANALAAAPPSAASGAIAASLVFDDVAEPLTAGVRGTAQDRHLLFEADHWAIDLRVVRSDHALSITGQLANAATPTQGCAGVAVLAWSAAGVVGRGLTGSLGEFTIACPDVGSLTLEIRSSPAITIGIPPART